MRTKPEQHTGALRLVLMMGCWLSGLLGASLLAQPGPDGGGGSSTNGIPEAPTNGLYYARLNAAWKDFAPGLYTMQDDAPEEGGYYARSANAWKLIQSTVTGGTLDVLVAAAAEFQPDGVDGTLIPRNSSRFIALNHLYDPDGLITALNQTNRTFRVQTGTYQVTVVVPMVPSGTGPGNNRIPYTISLWDVSGATNIYYSSYTLYDDDRTQVTSVFMPIFEARSDRDYAIRVQNLDADQDLLAGLDNEVPNLDNHYSELSIMKLSGAVSLPATTWAVTNLLVNTALEVGTVGQAIGYTAPGEVGVVSLGSGGASGPAVDLSAIRVSPYFNARSDASPITFVPRGDSMRIYAAVNTPMQMGMPYWDMAPGSANASENSGASTTGIRFTGAGAAGLFALATNQTTIGNHYRMVMSYVINKTAMEMLSPAPSPRWSDVVWQTPTNITVNNSINIGSTNQYVQSTVTFQAESTNAIETWFYCATDPSSSEQVTINGVVVSDIATPKFPIGDVFADVPADGFPYVRQYDDGYGSWKKQMPERVASATIVDPELVYATSPEFPLLSVESSWANYNIQLVRLYLKTDAPSTYSIKLESRTVPDQAGTILGTVATSAGMEASITLTNEVSSGQVLMLTLPTNDVRWIQAALVYKVLTP